MSPVLDSAEQYSQLLDSAKWTTHPSKQSDVAKCGSRLSQIIITKMQFTRMILAVAPPPFRSVRIDASLARARALSPVRISPIGSPRRLVLVLEEVWVEVRLVLESS